MTKRKITIHIGLFDEHGTELWAPDGRKRVASYSREAVAFVPCDNEGVYTNEEPLQVSNRPSNGKELGIYGLLFANTRGAEISRWDFGSSIPYDEIHQVRFDPGYLSIPIKTVEEGLKKGSVDFYANAGTQPIPEDTSSYEPLYRQAQQAKKPAYSGKSIKPMSGTKLAQIMDDIDPEAGSSTDD